MKHLFFALIIGLLGPASFAAEVSTECTAMNQERENQKATKTKTAKASKGAAVRQ